jgi:plasmid stabilization system protein ParE
MALEIKWSKKADRSFDMILEYLTKEWGEKVSKAFVRKAYDLFDILSEFPEIGTVENQEKNIRGIVIVKQIIIFYTIRENKIILLDFFDCRKNPETKIL